MAIPQNLIDQAKAKFDLTDPADQESLYALTEALYADSTLSDAELLASAQASLPLELKLSAKLVLAKRFMVQNTKALKLAVVFAMWGEQNRLRPKSPDNPNGEDSLRVKLAQLDWICRDTPVEWTLYAVDDGCPHGSGKLAAEIAASHPLGSHVKTIFLADHIPTESGPLAELASVNDSRKGGAVILGCQQAIADGAEAVIYTDADNSVHLGQIGLLLQPYLTQGTRVILGNRKHPDAVLVKQESRWGVGIKLLRHMQRMVGQAIFSRNILDTQAAFKLYDSQVLSNIIADPTVYDFSFDTDWILAVIAMDEPFAQVPFAFIDSFAESASITQGPMTTWETLLMGLVKAVRKHQVPHNKTMARVLDEEIHSSADLDLLIHHLPPELADAPASAWGDPAVMSPEAVQTWIKQRKAAA